MLSPSAPLAERMRPADLGHYIGQSHLVGENGVIRLSLSRKTIPSIIFWGPPGVGKTTLARIFAKALNCSSRKDSYPSELKSGNFGQEAPQNSCLERETIAQRQGSSEELKFEIKPTQ